MDTTENMGGETITGEYIEEYRLNAIIRGLAIEVQTGMKVGRGASMLTLARAEGLTNKSTKAAALVQIVDRMDTEGIPVSGSVRTAYRTAKKKGR